MKAVRIYGRKERTSSEFVVGYVWVSGSKCFTGLDKFLKRMGINIARLTGASIGELVKAPIRKDDRKDSNSMIYKIPCNGCVMAYYRESPRGIDKCIREHKNKIKPHWPSNSSVVHAESYGHLPSWQQVEVLHRGYERKTRRILEAVCIATNIVSNHYGGFVSLEETTSKKSAVKAGGRGGGTRMTKQVANHLGEATANQEAR